MDDILPGTNQQLIADTKALIEKNKNLIDKLSAINEERALIQDNPGILDPALAPAEARVSSAE